MSTYVTNTHGFIIDEVDHIYDPGLSAPDNDDRAFYAITGEVYFPYDGYDVIVLPRGVTTEEYNEALYSEKEMLVY